MEFCAKSTQKPSWESSAQQYLRMWSIHDEKLFEMPRSMSLRLYLMFPFQPPSKFPPIMIKLLCSCLSDTTASATTASSSLLSPTLQASTITEQMPTKSSHLDYQNYQNDGEYVASMPKQYHSGEADLDNEEAEDDFHGNALDRGPFFEVSATKNITAIAGHSAYLNCRVRNLGNRTVSLVANLRA